FYLSGQFLTEDYYVANKLMKGFIGSSNIDTNSRLCMASSVAGHVRAFGEDVVPGTYDDWDAAELVVSVGSNSAWCHPVLHARLLERAARTVVIDPRRTATADGAILHLPLRAGSDVALFNGLLCWLADRGHVDRDYVSRHTAGFDAALAAARAGGGGDLAAVAEATGLPEADVARFFDLFATTERVMTVYSQGVNQSAAGTDKVNAILNCHLATGRIGRPGSGPFSITGQPNAMGGREVGGLANQLAAHMGFEPASLDRVARFWNAPTLAQRPGLKAVELFEAVADGRIKAIWIAATNPAASMPRADAVRDALRRCPLVVAADCWDTDTTGLAHVVLPAAGWGEKDGTVTNSERCLSRQRRFREPPGEARPDWWMFRELARRLGHGAAFDWNGPAEIFREHAALTAFENGGERRLDLGRLAAIDSAGYAAMAPRRWPLAAAGSGEDEGGRLYGNGRFSTADGRGRFVAVTPRGLAARTDERFPLRLNTGRLRDQWHTMSRTGLVPRLSVHADQPVLRIAPADAERGNIADGALVRVETAHGTLTVVAEHAAEQGTGTLFLPIHWTDRNSAAGPVARLVGAHADPVSGQPELKATPAAMPVPVPVFRHGVMAWDPDAGDAGPSAATAPGLYWVRMAVPNGSASRLRVTVATGWADEALVETLLPAGNGAARVWRREDDADAGATVAAVIRNGTVVACLVLHADGDALPGPTRLAACLGTEVAAGREALVLDRLLPEPGTADTSRTVCACMTVNETTLCGAIRQGELRTVAALGEATGAGTRCGACRPEIGTLLRTVLAENGRVPDAEPASERNGRNGREGQDRMDDASFSTEQQDYLKGFMAGVEARRTALGLPMAPTGAGAGGAAAADPADEQARAWDRTLAAGGKLTAEEEGKRKRHPLDRFDEVAARAR
ncbi:MAG: molybdopterin-dependent oxidoreductase, partial [Gluconacetobacter diazotrophicus]|nr:molybdopterin-dependent oxidoreductase [Gluconacetobacter diazotrophicus]